MALITLVNIPSQKAVMGSDFTPILGQYGVNIREFCNQFNLKTKNIIEGFPLNVLLSSKSKDNFVFIYISISLNFLVHYYFNLNNNKYLSLVDIWKILNIYIYFLKINNLYILNDLSYAKIIIAYIKSFNIKINL